MYPNIGRDAGIERLPFASAIRALEYTTISGTGVQRLRCGPVNCQCLYIGVSQACTDGAPVKTLILTPEYPAASSVHRLGHTGVNRQSICVFAGVGFAPVAAPICAFEYPAGIRRGVERL